MQLDIAQNKVQFSKIVVLPVTLFYHVLIRMLYRADVIVCNCRICCSSNKKTRKLAKIKCLLHKVKKSGWYSVEFPINITFPIFSVRCYHGYLCLCI